LADDGRAVIEISDSGCGIPADQLGKIFNPFFTTRAPGQGTGLGLSICHSFVARFSGTIDVESDLGRGCTFRVLLPPAASGVQLRVSVPETIPPVEPARGEPPSEPIRVLVADDEPLVCSVLEHVLSECEVTVVSSGRGALELLSSGRDFDVVLCDLNLDDLSGLDVFDGICRDWPEMRPRFVLMTGGVRSQKQAERLATSGARVLSKPFELDLLLSIVESTATLARTQRASAR
jgi:CheY-like chemotaxis protein